MRACSTLRMAWLGLNGSITTATERRTGPSSSGPRKSGPTSTPRPLRYPVGGVPCPVGTQATPLHLRGHRPRPAHGTRWASTAGAVVVPDSTGGGILCRVPVHPQWAGLTGPADHRGQRPRIQYPFHQDVGVGQQPAQGAHLAAGVRRTRRRHRRPPPARPGPWSDRHTPARRGGPRDGRCWRWRRLAGPCRTAGPERPRGGRHARPDDRAPRARRRGDLRRSTASGARSSARGRATPARSPSPPPGVPSRRHPGERSCGPVPPAPPCTSAPGGRG